MQTSTHIRHPERVQRVEGSPRQTADSFYNTIHLPNEQLHIAEQDARSQQQIILDMFRRHPHAELTPFQVQVRCHLTGSPITSIRRAMTNLTKAGHLKKNGSKKQERYGQMNYTWSLNTNSKIKL